MFAAPVLAFLAFLATQVQGKNIFCYYSSFAQTRHGLGNFLPENINANLCSHIIFAFVDITPDGRDLISFNRNDLGPRGLYARTMALKKINPSLKVLLAVGGWQIGSKPFIPMIQNEDIRRVWIKNVVSYLRRHSFDGFDVDWEFPATRGSPPEDKYRFTLLMKGLFEAFAEEASATGNEKLLLTLATASGTYYIDQSYEPDKIINYIDFMLLMTYNYHGQWEKITGHHSGLYRHKDDPTTGEKAQLYQQWSIDYWLDVGVPKEKLVVGIPTYGMSFTLADPSDNGVQAPATGGGRMGDYTRETGILAYYEICLNMRDKGWNSVWIEDQAAPYVQGGNQWVGYENQKSIILKAKNIKARDLAGAFVWSVEMDDFRGACGKGQYPLLTAIQDVLNPESHSNSAAGQPDPHSTTSEEVTYTTVKDRSTRHQTTSSVSPKRKMSKSRKVQKPWQKHSGRKTYRMVQIEMEAAATLSQTTTGPISAESASGSGEEQLQTLWWTNPELRDAKTMRPKMGTSTRPGRRGVWRLRKQFRGENRSRLSKETPQMAKVADKTAISEGQKVKSWQTARWWTGASEAVVRNPEQGHPSPRGSPRPDLAIRLDTTTMFDQPIDSTTPRGPRISASSTATSPSTVTTTTALPRTRAPATTPLPRTEAPTTTLPRTRAPTTTPLPRTRAPTTTPLPRTRAPTTEALSRIEAPITTPQPRMVAPTTVALPRIEVPSTPSLRLETASSQESREEVGAHIDLIPSDVGTVSSEGGPETRQCRVLGVGTFADPFSCEHFLVCMPGNWLNYPPHVMACPAGTRFDSGLKICNYASRVTCKH